MPKAMSINERKIIRENLKNAAAECLALYGAKKTTVDELVRRVNIPKGTFYLFYESKELLFFDLFQDYHDKLHKHFFDRAEKLSEVPEIEELTDMIMAFYLESLNSYFLRIITSGDLEYIIRKLPEKVTEEHFKKDDDSITEFIRLIPNIDQSKAKVYGAVFRAIFLTMLNKSEIGSEVYDETLRMLIRGAVMQMVKK